MVRLLTPHALRHLIALLSLLGALLGPRALLAYVLTTFMAVVLAGMLLDALGLAKYVKKVRIVKRC